MTSRRDFLRGAAQAMPLLIAAPAIVRYASIMPVKVMPELPALPRWSMMFTARVFLHGRDVDGIEFETSKWPDFRERLRIKELDWFTVESPDGKTVMWRPPEPTAPSALMEETVDQYVRAVVKTPQQ